jgi:hypothetical protein
LSKWVAIEAAFQRLSIAEGRHVMAALSPHMHQCPTNPLPELRTPGASDCPTTFTRHTGYALRDGAKSMVEGVQTEPLLRAADPIASAGTWAEGASFEPGSTSPDPFCCSGSTRLGSARK